MSAQSPVERRTSRGFCCAIHGCPLLREFRLHLVAHNAQGAPAARSFSTPHRVCRLHDAAIARGVGVLTVADIACPAEQHMVIEAARAECGWPAAAEVTLTVAVRSA